MPDATNEMLLNYFGEGTRLISHSTSRESSVRELLTNKVVLLYFSSSWCGPCKRFTPILIGLYRRLKSNQAEDFEIVFCGMDTMLCLHQQYASTMPWWSLPFQSTVITKLSSIYNASGIPHLVVLDRDGSVLLHDGVEQIASDPMGSRFPWRPRRVVDLLPELYLRSDGSLASMRELDSKYLMIYAAAGYCPPCQRLTPTVTEIYLQLKAQRDDVEFLFMSSDRNQSEFDIFFATMGFGAIPFGERKAVTELVSHLDIRCMPTLLMFGPRPLDGGKQCDRPLINANVRDIFQRVKTTACVGSLMAHFPFAPLAFGDLNEVSDDINATKCVVIFCENCDDEEQQDIIEKLQSASRAYFPCKQQKAMRFYWACKSTQLTKALRDMLNLRNAQGPKMVLLDFPDRASYYESPCNTETSVDSILNFIHHPGKRHTL